MKCPWIREGLRISPDGDMVPCCEYKGRSGINVNSSTVNEYRSSRFLDSLEEKFAMGEFPIGCSLCKQYEDHKIQSRRLTLPLENQKNQIDIVLGNVCNSDCGMCGPSRSSKIVSRLIHHPLPGKLIDPWADSFLLGNYEVIEFDADLYKTLLEFDSIKLVGGEPFLTKKIWKILDHLSRQKPQTTINIVTNGSVSDGKQLEILSRFNEVVIQFSIDAVGKHHEWVRYGLKWQEIESNVEKIRKIATYSNVLGLASALTITNTADLLNWAYERKLEVEVNPIYDPQLLNVSNVPKHIVLEQIERIKATIPFDTRSEILRNVLIRYLKQNISTDQLDHRTRKYIEYLNKTRQTYLDPDTLTVQ